MSKSPIPIRKLSLPPTAFDAIVEAMAATAGLATDVDGLVIDRATGMFSRRGLIPGWLVVGGVRMGAGELALTWLAVLPDPDAPPGPGTATRVTARLLRSVPVAVLLTQVQRRLAAVDDATRAAYGAMTGETPYWPQPTARRQTGRPSRKDDNRKQDLLRRVATAYLDGMGTAGVYARLAHRFKRSLDPDPIRAQEQVKALVRAARKDEWLSGATHGARGATPGPRLIEYQRISKTKGEQ